MKTVGHNGETVKPETAEERTANARACSAFVNSWQLYQQTTSRGAFLPPVARPDGWDTGGGASPSLSVCHNCITEQKPAMQLPGSSRKMAEVIRLEVERLAKVYGLERLGFLTLSFQDSVFSIQEAQRRFHSALTNCLSRHFKGGLTVWERFDHGIHFHLLVVLDEDIRTGFDFEAVKRRDYRSASHYLRALWATLRVCLPDYQFGRHELLPIRTVAEAVGRYLGKYLSKHLDCKLDKDKGARIVRFFGVAKYGRVASAQFGWANGRSYIWRLGVGAFAEHFRVSWSGLSRIGGPRWAFHLGKAIFDRGLARWKEVSAYAETSVCHT